MVTAPGGPGITTIDCEHAGYAFYAWNTSISGFTVRHGVGVPEVQFGAVFIRDGELSDCVLEDNDCMGLVTYGGSSITDCVFRGNTDYGVELGPEGLMGRSMVSDCLFEGNARGLHVYMPDTGRPIPPRWILDCTFIDNGLPVVAAYYTSPVVQRCVIAGNYGSGSCIALTASYCELRQCTIVGNESSSGAVFQFASDVHYDCGCSIAYSIVAFNSCQQLAGGIPGDSAFSNDCVFGNAWGDTFPGDLNSSGVVAEDPLFCDMDAGDYTLCSNSPCLAENEPEAVAMGAFPDAAGCPACNGSPVLDISWGVIKALFR